MHKPSPSFLIALFGTLLLTCAAASAASGPQTAWNVFTLPNPEITPDWRSYAPGECKRDPEACAKDFRFWEQWDFRNFQSAIDASFATVHSAGYKGVMLILPFGDTSTYWNNISLMYRSAAGNGVRLEVVLFPKWKFGSEYCYLYPDDAPSGCKRVAGTSTAVAFQKLLKLMNFVQNLGGGCAAGSYHRPFAVWYGWSNFSPGYAALKSFWESLPAASCDLRASYITWLDTRFTGAPEVQQLQQYVLKELNQPYWVNTELYSAAQIQQYATAYAPYQTVITGVHGANSVVDWARGMCAKWKAASQPDRLGVWTFSDHDFSKSESYRVYINGSMADVGAVCNY